MNELAKAYLETEIVFTGSDGVAWATVAADTEGSISRPGGALGLLNLASPSALIITAWNPLSQQLKPLVNADLQSGLIDDLNHLGINFVTVLGQEPGGGWIEESLLIPYGEEEEVFAQIVDLAEKYQQNAIFELTATKKRVISVCLAGLDGEAGYRLLPLGPEVSKSQD